MQKPIVTDETFLAQKCAPATREDIPVAQDLLDTLAANAEGCVGLAANMIGVQKCILVFEDDDGYHVMFNPEIEKQRDAYQAEEACLSLTGTRCAKRYRTIKVKYHTPEFQVRHKTFTGFPAQIIQHEIDHCNGILI